jgi:hypothetical protein
VIRIVTAAGAGDGGGMTSTSTTDPHDPTRTGAVWVTGTGALLLFAAAAVFTAVRWDQIRPEAKLAALGVATGACLAAGRRLAATLPATAGALFHLGTFLVPVNVAALAINAGAGWPQLLLAQGLAATVTFGWAASVERSVVLRWAWGASVVLFAGGVGAVTPIPPALLLAGAAVAAARHGLDRPGLGWGATAALAPAAALLERMAGSGQGTVARLGLAPGHLPIAAACAAVGGAAAIALVARRRSSVDLGLVSAVVGLVGLGGAWTGTRPEGTSTAIVLALALLGLELAALVLRHDRFWQLPVAAVAGLAERGAAIGTALLVPAAILVQGFGATDGRLALAAALLAAGWTVADRRRGEGGMALATTAVAVCAVSATALSTTSSLVIAVVLAVAAVAAVVAGRRDAAVAAVPAACLAPLVGDAHLGLVAATALLGAAAVGQLAVEVSCRPEGDELSRRTADERSIALALLSLLPLGLGAFAAAVHVGATAAVLVAAVAAAWATAAWIDRGRPVADLPLGTVVRAGSVATLCGAGVLRPLELAVVAGVVAAASLADAIRLRVPHLALGASLALPVAVGAFVRSTGVSEASTGVGLAVAAVVIAGLGALQGRGWLLPVAAAVGVAMAGAVELAQHDAAALSYVLLAAGALTAAGGLAVGREDLQVLGAAAGTASAWLRLGAAEVHIVELYLLPVAALLVAFGVRAQARGASSWIAYGPAIGLLGGAALAERIGGGSGWHAVAAGAVGVGSVVAGGQRRLAAPLVLGTGLLVGLCGLETLAITARLDTWTWLALGGGALLAAGVAMERREVGPLETGRRLVDVVAERYR